MKNIMLIISLSVLLVSIHSSELFSEESQNTALAVKTINSLSEFKTILDTSGDELLIFDLYADWCIPCKILSPMLETIAKENENRASFYKINVDQHPKLASAFKVTGLPHVVFLKNKKAVHALTGVQPKDTYVRAIHRLSEKGDEGMAVKADGEIINGIRVVPVKAGINPHVVYVYRGETIKLVFDQQDYPYSVHIPEFGISKKAKQNQQLNVSFKAKKIGVYPIFCNGNCPAGDGAMSGKIIVMQYQPTGEVKYDEVNTVEAKVLVDHIDDLLILDVRTPAEHYKEHIYDSTLIPLHQLSERLSEIEKYKDKDVLVYCRAGNRSTVASEILIDKGFTKVYNMRDGLIGWEKRNYPLVK
jgi:thioredoxin